MKQGDKYPVTIAGQVVAQAEIREVGNGTATLVVPGTVVVMATRTELTDTPQDTDTTGTQTIIESVERQTAPEVAPVVEAPAAEVVETAEAPVVESEPEAPVATDES